MTNPESLQLLTEKLPDCITVIVRDRITAILKALVAAGGEE